MLILVTGAAGYIGSHTVVELLNSGYEVVCIDNFANAISDDKGIPISLQRVGEIVGKPILFEKVDICNLNDLEKIFEKHNFNAVIHLASLKAVSESIADPLRYYSNNLTGSLNLCQMCKKYQINNFIFSSSATVYGEPSELPITEHSKTGDGVTNPYGQSKCMVERILMDIGKSNQNFNIIILRYFNPVGAHKSGKIGENPKGVPTNLMPYISQVAVGKLDQLTVHGNDFNTFDGTGVRDFIHVVDLAIGHVKALDRFKTGTNIGTEIYNLGTGQGYSVLQMVEAFEKASGKNIKLKIGERRPGDLPSVYCDPSLACQKLNWKCRFGLNEMCQDLWNWQSKNPNGFDTLKKSEKQH